MGVLAGTHWGDNIQAERQPLCGCVGGWCSLLCLSRHLRGNSTLFGSLKKIVFSFSFSARFQYVFLVFHPGFVFFSLCFFLSFFSLFPFFRAMGQDSGEDRFYTSTKRARAHKNTRLTTSQISMRATENRQGSCESNARSIRKRTIVAEKRPGNCNCRIEASRGSPVGGHRNSPRRKFGWSSCLQRTHCRSNPTRGRVNPMPQRCS